MSSQSERCWFMAGDFTRIATVHGDQTCASYEIRREGPGARSFAKKRVDVGNEYGVARQMARDAAKLWGCPPPAESGFDGVERGR